MTTACAEALEALSSTAPATRAWLQGMHTLSRWAAETWPPTGPGVTLPAATAAFVDSALRIITSLWCDTPSGNLTPVSDERIIGDVEFDTQVDKIRGEIASENAARTAAAAAATKGEQQVVETTPSGAPFIPAAIQFDYELALCTPAQVAAVRAYRERRDAAISGELGDAAAFAAIADARAAYDTREAVAAGWTDPSDVLNATEDIALSNLPGTLVGCLVVGQRFTVGMYYARLYLILFMLRGASAVAAGKVDMTHAVASIATLTRALEAFATPPRPPLSSARIALFEGLLWRAGVLLHTPAAVPPAVWDDPLYASRERRASTIAWLALLAARLQRLVGDVALFTSLSALPRWEPPPAASALAAVFNTWLTTRVATSLLPHVVTEAAFGALLSESLLPGDGDLVSAAAVALDAYMDTYVEDELIGQTSEFTPRTAKFVAASINRPLVASLFTIARRGLSAVLGLPPPSTAGALTLLDFILSRGAHGYRFMVPSSDEQHGIACRVGNWGLLAPAAGVPVDDPASSPALVHAGSTYFVVVGGASSPPDPSFSRAFCTWLAHIGWGPAAGFLHVTPSFVFGSGPDGFAFLRDPTAHRTLDIRPLFADLFEMAHVTPGESSFVPSGVLSDDFATLAAHREIRRLKRAVPERDTLYGAR